MYDAIVTDTGLNASHNPNNKPYINFLIVTDTGLIASHNRKPMSSFITHIVTDTGLIASHNLQMHAGAGFQNQ